jgi:hypothetical protein
MWDVHFQSEIAHINLDETVKPGRCNEVSL